MRYIGNKTNLLKNINQVIKDNCDGNEKVFCDLFSGTSSVARFFKNRYNIFDVHKKNEDAKVYNINCDDDVIRYENGDIYKLLDEAIYCIMTVSECSNKL